MLDSWKSAGYPAKYSAADGIRDGWVGVGILRIEKGIVAFKMWTMDYLKKEFPALGVRKFAGNSQGERIFN